MRYVGYVRISSEDQRGNYSLDAQKHAIRLWVAQQNNDLQGVLVRFYEDEAFTGTTDERPAFQEMVADAGKSNSMASSSTSSTGSPAIVTTRASTSSSFVPCPNCGTSEKVHNDSSDGRILI